MKEVHIKNWGKLYINNKPHKLVHEDDMPIDVQLVAIQLNDSLIKTLRDVLNTQEKLNEELRRNHKLNQELRHE